MLGDVNADGHVDISDALIIASYSVDPTNPNLPAGIAEGVEPEVPTYAVSGFVRNRAGEALQGAQIWLGPLTTVTDFTSLFSPARSRHRRSSWNWLHTINTRGC